MRDVYPEADPEALYQLAVSDSPYHTFVTSDHFMPTDLYVPIRRRELRRNVWAAICAWASFEWDRIAACFR